MNIKWVFWWRTKTWWPPPPNLRSGSDWWRRWRKVTCLFISCYFQELLIHLESKRFVMIINHSHCFTISWILLINKIKEDNYYNDLNHGIPWCSDQESKFLHLPQHQPKDSHFSKWVQVPTILPHHNESSKESTVRRPYRQRNQLSRRISHCRRDLKVLLLSECTQAARALRDVWVLTQSHLVFEEGLKPEEWREIDVFLGKESAGAERRRGGQSREKLRPSCDVGGECVCVCGGAK